MLPETLLSVAESLQTWATWLLYVSVHVETRNTPRTVVNLTIILNPTAEVYMNACSLTGALPESMGSLANLGKSRRRKRRVLCCCPTVCCLTFMFS